VAPDETMEPDVVVRSPPPIPEPAESVPEPPMPVPAQLPAPVVDDANKPVTLGDLNRALEPLNNNMREMGNTMREMGNTMREILELLRSRPV